jgi:hypothetical protein
LLAEVVEADRVAGLLIPGRVVVALVDTYLGHKQLQKVLHLR